MTIKTIVFDLDETLVSHKESLIKFIGYQYNKFYNELSQINFFQWKNSFIEFDNNGYTTKDIVYEKLIKYYDVNIDFDSLYTDFNKNFYKFTSPYEGTNETLHFLKSKGFSIGLISNGGGEIQDNKIKYLGYHKIFDYISISGYEKVEKPDPDIFLKMLRVMEADKSSCIFIGDHPLNDIWGAKNIGLNTVWISHGENWSEKTFHPDYIISSIEEILPIIGENTKEYVKN